MTLLVTLYRTHPSGAQTLLPLSTWHPPGSHGLTKIHCRPNMGSARPRALIVLLFSRACNRGIRTSSTHLESCVVCVCARMRVCLCLCVCVCVCVYERLRERAREQKILSRAWPLSSAAPAPRRARLHAHRLFDHSFLFRCEKPLNTQL